MNAWEDGGVRRALPALVTSACILLAVIGAAAADPAADRLFREGRRLLRAGQVAEACERFADSQRIEPSVGTLLNLGDCHERMGRLATAWTTFQDARALAAQRRDRRATEAGVRSARLEARLAFLTVVGPPEPVELVVARDGVRVASTGWDQGEPLAPGMYTIEARASGYQPWSSSVQLIAGQRARVVVVLAAELRPLAAVPAEPAAGAISADGGSQARRAPTPRARPLPLRSVGIGVAVGANHREVPVIGARAIAGIPLPGGALRGTATVSYSRYEEPLDPVERTTTISVGLGGDYVWMPLPQLAFAAGLGIGFDRDQIHQGDMTSTDLGAWWMLHASPLLVRALGGHLELGLHVQVARAGDEWTTIMLASADVFLR